MPSTGNVSTTMPDASEVTTVEATAWWRYGPPLLIALAFVPILIVHARMLWSRPHYQLFPMVVPGAIALAYRYARHLGPLSPGQARTAALGAAAGWALLVFGVVFVSPPVGMVSALVTLLAAIYALGGRRLVLALLPAWGFLWLAVPLPSGLDLRLVSGLQNLVSRWSSQLLDAFHVFHVMEGNVVEVARRRLLVDQACSGIYSLLTLLMGAIFYALWTRTGWIRGMVLLAAAVFWVLAGNVARIVSIVLLFDRRGIDASGGKKHEALGIALFVMMLLMVASSDRLYAFIEAVGARTWAFLTRARKHAGGRSRSAAGRGGQPEKGPRAAEAGSVGPQDGARTKLAPLRRAWVGSTAWGAVFGLMLLPQYLMPGVDWREVLATNDVYSKPFEKLVAESMPAVWPPGQAAEGPFVRLGFNTEHRKMDDSWGENSRIWMFRKGTRSAALSVDYQFVGWHELTLCYSSKGWQAVGRRVVSPGPGQPATVVVVDMLDPQGAHGMVVYGMYLVDGTPVMPPEARGYIQSLAGRLLGWFGAGSRSSQAIARLNHQIQLMIESETPLTPAEREQALAFFNHGRSVVQEVGLGVKGAK